ncbi:MAG: hypothetical protein JRE24_12235 [Deltaproteobacteria bacterium]|nr:hypothetical protein [Deltaproteobacteria bacterium]
MQDDIIAALTQEVKEEVVENYFHARRLIEEQINYVNELAEQTAGLEEAGCEHLTRIYNSLIEPEFADEFRQTVGLKDALFGERLDEDSRDRKHLGQVKVRGLTQRAKFKRLLLESYRGLYTWTSQYKEAYEDLQGECKAVNRNLKKFESDFDLLTLLNFLKDLDVELVEKKHCLGENFTPKEMASIESSLSFKPIRIERFKLDPPPNLPKPNTVQRELNSLADCVYGQCSHGVKALVK